MGGGQSGGTRARTGKARGQKGASKGGGGGAATAHAVAAASGPTPSQASVKFKPGTDRFEANREMARLLGSRFTLQDFASASGAPDNAKVSVKYIEAFGSIPARFSATVKSKELKEMTRTFTVDSRGRPIIKNNIFEAKVTGTGLGLKLFSAQVANATALGFKAIKTYAARDEVYNGAITWAKFGYNARLTREVRESLPAQLQGARSLHELRKTQVGRDWWTEHGGSTDMRFNLAPGSRSQKELVRYATNKAKAMENRP
jgi:hypothetical protein